MHRINVCLFIIFFFWTSTAIAQQNELLKLPFGIVLGKTTAAEIENYGICEEKIKVRDNYFRCKYYLVNDRFAVHMSQNEKAVRVWFNLRYIPRNWKRLGFKEGVSEKDFIALIKSLGAQYIERIDSRKGGCDIEFVVGNYLYKATINSGYFAHIAVSHSY